MRLVFWILPHFLAVVFFLEKMSGKAYAVVDHYISFSLFVVVVLLAFCALGALLYPARLLIKRHAVKNPSFVVLTFCVLVPGLLFFISANRCAKTGLEIVHAIRTPSVAASGSFLERNFHIFFSSHIFLICVCSLSKHVPGYLKAVRNFSSERHDAKLDRIINAVQQRTQFLNTLFVHISIALAVWPILGVVVLLWTSSVSLVLASLTKDLFLGILKVISIRCERWLLDTLLSKHVILYILKPRRAVQAGVGSVGLVFYIVSTALRNPTELADHIEHLTPHRWACRLVLTIRALSAPAGFVCALMFNDTFNSIFFDVLYERPGAVMMTIAAVCVPTLGIIMYARIRNNVGCFQLDSISHWRRVFHILPFKVPKLDFFLSRLDAKMNAPVGMQDIRVVLDNESPDLDGVHIEWTNPSTSRVCTSYQVGCVQCNNKRSWFGSRGNPETENTDLTVTEPRATMANLRDLYFNTFNKYPFAFRVRGRNRHGHFGKWSSSSQIWGRFCEMETPPGPVVCGKRILCSWRLFLGLENEAGSGQQIDVESGDFVGIYPTSTPVENSSQYLKYTDCSKRDLVRDRPGWQTLQIETPSTYAEGIPVAIHFTHTSSDASDRIAGYYILSKEVINSKPVYDNMNAVAYLRMGPNGKWIISDKAAKNANAATGWCSSSGSPGVHPAKATKWVFHANQGEQSEPQTCQLRPFTGVEWTAERERLNFHHLDSLLACPAETNNISVELRYFGPNGDLLGRSKPFQLITIDEPAISIERKDDMYKVTITPSTQIFEVEDMRYKCLWRRNAIVSKWYEAIGMGDNSTTIRMIKATDLQPSTEYIVKSYLYFEHEEQQIQGKYNEQTFTTPADLPCVQKPKVEDVIPVQVDPTSMRFELPQPDPITKRYELQWRNKTLVVSDTWRPVEQCVDADPDNPKKVIFLLSELEPEHQYQLHYRITARNGDCGPWSDNIDFKTLPAIRTPRQAAAPKVTEVTTQSVVLTVEDVYDAQTDSVPAEASASEDTPASPNTPAYTQHIPAQTYEVRISLYYTLGGWKVLDTEPQQLPGGTRGARNFVFALEDLDAGSTYVVQARGKAEEDRFGPWSESTKFVTLDKYVQSLPTPGLPVISTTETGQSRVNVGFPSEQVDLARSQVCISLLGN